MMRTKDGKQMISDGMNSWNTLGYKVMTERLNTSAWRCQKRNLG